MSLSLALEANNETNNIEISSAICYKWLKIFQVFHWFSWYLFTENKHFSGMKETKMYCSIFIIFCRKKFFNKFQWNNSKQIFDQRSNFKCLELDELQSLWHFALPPFSTWTLDSHTHFSLHTNPFHLPYTIGILACSISCALLIFFFRWN